MTVRFLPPRDVPKEPVSLLASAQHAKLAVSFWGFSSIKRLGLDRKTLKRQVVLNLMSGAVDPSVVDKLDRENVRSDDRLHAKVYWTDRGAIVGSCNASANGLGLIDDEIGSWKEAAIWLASDTPAWYEAGKCVDALFGAGEPITPAMLAEAEQLWIKRRLNRPWPRISKRISLAAALRDDPSRIRGRGLWLLIERAAQADPASEKEEAVAQSLAINPEAFDRWEGRVPLGMQAMVFDRSVNRCGQAKYTGTYLLKTLDKKAAYIKETGVTIAEATDAQELERKLKISFSKRDDGELLEPIFDHLWHRRKESWNSYCNREWESVLVSIDKVIAMLPGIEAFAKAAHSSTKRT